MAQKLSFVLRRRPELSREEFQQMWLEEHAPFVQARADLIGCKRYVQAHTELDQEARPGRPEPFDGVAELWFDGSLRQGTAEEQAQAGRELLEDERRFIDLEASPLWMSEERPVLEAGEGQRRLTYALRRRPEMTREQFQTYWWGTHGPLIRELAPDRLRRYVQVHTNADAETHPGRELRNAPEPFDGFALLWYDNSLAGYPEDDVERISKLIREDEAKFIHHPESPAWMSVEHVIIDR
ncbi:MAG: EthD domain-containing protein [Dehalococcoidia bacterium]